MIPAGYRAALAVPGAAAFSAAGALGRLPQAMVGLGSVLMLTGLGRSYALAGLVAGAIALSQGVASPWLSRLIDRLGQARVLLPQLLLHVALLAALVVAAERHASAALLVTLGIGTGMSLPQIGACARARWTALLGNRPTLDAALSVESLIDEAVFIIGPVLVSALATTVAPAAGLIAAIGIVLIGGLLFLNQRGTEPPVHPPGARTSASTIRAPGLLVILGVFFALGALFGLIEVGIVALAREHGSPSATGVMLALWATGSLICGTIYGAVHWRIGAPRRFQLGAMAMAVGAVLIAVASRSLLVETFALIIAGLANAPTLITGNTLVPQVVSARSVTEAYTWLGVTVFVGISLGAPVGGVLIDHVGAQGSLWAGAAAGAVAAAIATTGRARLTARQPRGC